jgi:hypothetical protein
MQRKRIDTAHLKICSATKMDIYEDNCFDFSYPTWVFAYLKPDQVADFVFESYRITKNISFPNGPTYEVAKNERPVSHWYQYFVNSTEWWLSRFEKKSKVDVIDSSRKEKVIPRVFGLYVTNKIRGFNFAFEIHNTIVNRI